MEKIYFKTEKAFQKAVKEESGKITSVQCACGESRGCYLENKTLILCEGCYEEAANDQKGE